MDLLLDPPIPVVMMGAMRHPLAISPDGAGNLAHAVRLASDPRVAKRFRDIGVMVTMLDQAWAAVDVAKANSHLDAFTAPETGPVAVFLEDRCRLVEFSRPGLETSGAKFDFLARVDPAALAAKPVALATIAMGEAGGWLSAMAPTTICSAIAAWCWAASAAAMCRRVVRWSIFWLACRWSWPAAWAADICCRKPMVSQARRLIWLAAGSPMPAACRR